VYNFDEAGAHAEPWPEAVCVPIDAPFPDDAAYDEELLRHHVEHKRIGRRYHSLDFNCFDYVVQFLNMVAHNGSCSHTKHTVEVGLFPQRHGVRLCAACAMIVCWRGFVEHRT
jgi:hypothetical protein